MPRFEQKPLLPAGHEEEPSLPEGHGEEPPLPAGQMEEPPLPAAKKDQQRNCENASPLKNKNNMFHVAAVKMPPPLKLNQNPSQLNMFHVASLLCTPLSKLKFC